MALKGLSFSTFVPLIFASPQLLRSSDIRLFFCAHVFLLGGGGVADVGLGGPHGLFLNADFWSQHSAASLTFGPQA